MDSQPLSRYAGGKRSLLPQIKALMPKKFDGIHEPFAGGAALFWSLTSPDAPMPAILVDKNPFVTALYRGLQTDAGRVADTLALIEEDTRQGGLTREWYEEVRESANVGGGNQGAEMAARVLWLNRRCFNGLMRVNRKGELNVPMGAWKSGPPLLPKKSEILAWGAALQNAQIHNVAVAGRANWVYYVDPPYWGGFVQYTEGGFTWEDQEDAAIDAWAAASRGAYVIASNSDTEAIRGLYKDQNFSIHEVSRPGTINSDGTKRARVGELLMTAGV